MPTDPFSSHIADLQSLGGSRVWSLMVSLFGDLARAPGTYVDGPVLSRIMALLEIRPEAVRVALHRLRNDGWIESEKRGRTSRHRLTDKGRAESAAASPRIYAQPPSGDEDWQLVFLKDSDADTEAQLAEAGFAMLQPRLFAGSADLASPAGALSLPGDAAPGWVKDLCAPEDLRGPYEDLTQVLDRLKARLPPAAHLTAIEVAVLRTLIVHNWRRLVLRHPALPGSLIAQDWPGYRCHLLVDQLLTLFPRPDITAEDIGQAA
ncbi:MAG: PaaX family transcriptional regulator C-terminal domain-containing protein [Sulfitobacter sp.]|nr:PaaX family transcriptional regulator C-terminal domain-containing protein [Sulfitobacter sp.]